MITGSIVIFQSTKIQLPTRVTQPRAQIAVIKKCLVQICTKIYYCTAAEFFSPSSFLSFKFFLGPCPILPLSFIEMFCSFCLILLKIGEHITPPRPNSPLMKSHCISLDLNFHLNLLQITHTYKFQFQEIGKLVIGKCESEKVTSEHILPPDSVAIICQLFLCKQAK